MKRENWTVEYRNWIGASTYGLMFMRARKGRGRWRAATDLPEYVIQYLGLEKVRAYWCMTPMRRTEDFGPHITFAARVPNRIHIDMPALDLIKPAKTYSPLTLWRIFGHDSPAELYRVTYKYTDCGPSVGFHVCHADGDRWIYCDSLRTLGTWQEMADRGQRINWLSVGSIVEGTDRDCQTVEVCCDPLATLVERFGAAVEAVNTEANEIWGMTHGCDECGPETDEGRPVNPECKGCNGLGVIL